MFKREKSAVLKRLSDNILIELGKESADKKWAFLEESKDCNLAEPDPEK